MSDERFDKLLEVMLEVKEAVGNLEKRVGNLEKNQEEMNQKLDRIEDNFDLLAQKNWNNEKDIHRVKKLIGVE